MGSMILMLLMLDLAGCSAELGPGGPDLTPKSVSLQVGTFSGPLVGVIEATGDMLIATFTMHFNVSGRGGTFELNGAWGSAGSSAPVSIAGTVGYLMLENGNITLALGMPPCNQIGEHFAMPNGTYDFTPYQLSIRDGFCTLLSNSCAVLGNFQVLPSQLVLL